MDGYGGLFSGPEERPGGPRPGSDHAGRSRREGEYVGKGAPEGSCGPRANPPGCGRSRLEWGYFPGGRRRGHGRTDAGTRTAGSQGVAISPVSGSLPGNPGGPPNGFRPPTVLHGFVSVRRRDLRRPREVPHMRPGECRPRPGAPRIRPRHSPMARVPHPMDGEEQGQEQDGPHGEGARPGQRGRGDSHRPQTGRVRTGLERVHAAGAWEGKRYMGRPPGSGRRSADPEGPAKRETATPATPGGTGAGAWIVSSGREARWDTGGGAGPAGVHRGGRPRWGRRLPGLGGRHPPRPWRECRQPHPSRRRNSHSGSRSHRATHGNRRRRGHRPGYRHPPEAPGPRPGRHDPRGSGALAGIRGTHGIRGTRGTRHLQPRWRRRRTRAPLHPGGRFHPPPIPTAPQGGARRG